MGQMLDKALEDTLAVISSDLSVASWRTRAILSVLADRKVLLSPDLCPSSLLSKAGLSRGVLGTDFRDEMGVSLWRYVIQRRLEVAANLLQNTKLEIQYVAYLVGMSGAKQLRDNFKSHYNIPPIAVRSGKKTTVSWSPAVRARAKGIWLRIESLPQQIRSGLIRLIMLEEQGLRALIDLLGEKYLEEGRKCRQRGIEIAEIALIGVNANSRKLGASAHELRCLSLIWLSNAKRLAFDYVGAGSAIQEAEESWARLKGQNNLRVEAELLLQKGRLRFDQRKFDEALDLIDRSIHKSNSARADLSLAKALIHRAQIVCYSSRPTASAISNLEQALGIVKKHNGQQRLRVSLYTSLSYLYSLCGRFRGALQIATMLEELKDVDSLVPPLLLWLRALALLGLTDYDAAEDCFEESREGFLMLDSVIYAAIVSLDLARFHVSNGKTSAALRYASEALPVFESYGEYPEVLEILKVFRSALDAEKITTQLLGDARDRLIRLQDAPPL